jgi:anti-anti-sigma factor
MTGMQDALRVETERLSSRATAVWFVGVLDGTTVPAAALVLDPLKASPPRRLAIETSGVTSCDAGGLAAIAALAFAVRNSGGTVTTHGSTTVERVAEACGLTDYLGVRHVGGSPRAMHGSRSPDLQRRRICRTALLRPGR